MTGKILFLLVGLIVGYWFGWGRAHVVIAQECKKLGKFYVIDEVFHCVKVENNEDEAGEARQYREGEGEVLSQAKA